MNQDADSRLIDGPDGALKRLLEAGMDELPDAAQLDSLAAHLGPLLGPGGGPSGSDGPGNGSATEAGTGAPAVAGTGAVAGIGTVKLVAVVAAGIAAVAGGAFVMQPDSDVTAPAPPASIASVSAPVVPSFSPSVVIEPTRPAVPSSRPLPSTTTRDAIGRATTTAASSSQPIVPPEALPRESEPRALARAQDTLRSNPSEALAICNEIARTFPRGALGQEREVIAIEALTRLGRTSEATSRAEQFATSFPKSGHIRRLETLVGKKF
jgi:hypothetical protein